MKYNKGSFVVVPNKEAFSGAEPYVQCVYFWICNYADEKGVCFPSRGTIAEKAGCSIKSVDRALDLLVLSGLLTKKERRVGDRNLTNLYQIMVVDVGGVPQSLGGVPQSLGGVPQSLGVASEGRTELNLLLTQPTYLVADATDEVKPIKVRKNTAYLKVFELWGKYPANWRMNKTQIQAAKNLLEEQSMEDIKDSIRFAEKHKSEPFCPEISSPYDLDSKWSKLEAFYEKRV